MTNRPGKRLPNSKEAGTAASNGEIVPDDSAAAAATAEEKAVVAAGGEPVATSDEGRPEYEGPNSL